MKYLACLALAACASLSDGAKQNFAHQFTCPPAQVAATRVQPYHFAVDIPPELPPPPEVAADPQRLQYWHEEQAKAQKTDAKQNTDCPVVYDVSGCGQRTRLCCDHPSATDPTGKSVVFIRDVDCSPENGPAVEPGLTGSQGSLSYGLALHDILVFKNNATQIEVTVYSVWNDRPGGKALQQNDVILDIDGQAVHTSPEAAMLLRKLTPSPHVVHVQRAAATVDLQVPPAT